MASTTRSEYVSLLLRDLKPQDVQRGQYVVKHGSLTPPTCFEASVHLLTLDEGGRSTPVPDSLRAQFHFRTSQATGTITLDRAHDGYPWPRRMGAPA